MKKNIDCFLCHSNKIKSFESIQSFGLILKYYQCEICGLIFQSPKNNNTLDSDFYSEDYRKIYQKSAEPTKKDLWVQQKRAQIILSTIKTLIYGKPERHLDIGASSGILLETFKQAYGCESVGIEPGIAYREFAERQGLEMNPSIDSLLEQEPIRFDFISIIHVLEHLENPLETLLTIRNELLIENGYLLIEVPNFYFHDSYELAHLTCFTPHTLIEMVKKAGYQILFTNTHGLPRSSLLNLYITLLARPEPEAKDKQNIIPDCFVREKRRMGFLYRKLIQKIAPEKAWIPIPDEISS